MNLSDLERFDNGATIDEAALRQAGLVKGRNDGIKVLGNGKLSKKLTVHATKFSEIGPQADRSGRRHLPGDCSKLNFLETLRNIWAIEDLRKRVLFTFALLAVYRLGSHIPTPGVDPVALAEFFKAMSGGVFGFLDLFSGGALRRLSVFALGIMPYISASIILQLLTVVWPYLEKLSKEGEMGRRKINQYTRYGTVVLSIVQSLGVAFWLKSQTAPGGAPLVPPHVQDSLWGLGFPIMTVLTLTTGTAFIMWLGEQISERGIGNGISLIIFAGIVVNLPHAVFGIDRGHPQRTAQPLRHARS